ncbi:Membrane-associated enzyme, PAP2 (acid phosphatase) superfamily [Roseateles sp. YR242]|uniref:phosphatase PAP2 family protein n=1 Tax=Roseateles sp. YR242 TaxID=1855305 RepID=UPI0008B06522|nr:phosphatase PAP2 family protein [Roseateles sp. YR242]SEL76416.1 Membrane-associated enzyme, PAP2 (acid phosphatase) superfamily [Roseateles sp. YR242]
MKPLSLTELTVTGMGAANVLPTMAPTGPSITSAHPRALRRLSAGAWSVVLGLLVVLTWDALGLDLSAVRWFGDANGFAWRNHWLTAGLLHQGGRWLATGLAVVLLVNAVRPLWPGLTRRERWLAVAITAVCLVAIPLIKQGSTTSCPWDLAEFGGTAHYVSHWRFGLNDGGPGHCFPSGHASSAFAFFSLFFMLRRAYPRQARAALTGVLMMGLLYGLAQMARGAHYPSHTFWTGWICWAMTVGIVTLARPRPAAVRPD